MAGKKKKKEALPLSPWFHDIEEFYEFYSECDRCQYSGTRTNVCLGEGNMDAAVMVIDQQPGQEEDETGRPLMGPVGELFVKFFAAMHSKSFPVDARFEEFTGAAAGKKRMTEKRFFAMRDIMLDHIYVTPALMCYDPELRSEPPVGCIKACHRRLANEIYLVDPMMLLIMGKSACKSLLSTRDQRSLAMTQRHGDDVIVHIEGQVLPSVPYTAIMSIHPSFVYRRGEVKGVWADRFFEDGLMKAFEIVYASIDKAQGDSK